MSGHVFISYSRVDRAYVEELAAFLAAAGTEVWFDYEIEFGSRFDEEIQERIATCGVFVVVLTPDSARSTWVRREIGYADDRGKTIMPLLLAECDVPIRLTGSHHEDVTGGQMPSEPFLAQLRRLVTLAPEDQRPGSEPDTVAGIVRQTRDNLARIRAEHPGARDRMPKAAPVYDARDWPDPASIKTSEDFRSVLQMTLVRAGAPSYEELARRTGGILSAADVRDAMERTYFWESSADDDWREVSLILGAFGVSGALVAKWKRAFHRMLRLDPILEKRAAHPHSLARLLGWTLLGTVVLFLVGTALSQLPGGFGGGNWVAFAVSMLVLGFLVLGSGSSAWDAANNYGSTLLKIVWPVLFVAAFLTGWRVVGQLRGDDVATIGRVALSWLGWRF
ncbi:hypothetical protein F4553_007932 [Allocatelliglobosispora scoriae]|uniref:TIR domain-containing protein n=1 Tax=Allocatelliglobosispora scoriae TaxID=643052 RepID=A0A841C404_9ACTN|nr:toll/interleukin-1 receptor domain-containing protein [Allocatelliglobosispora scoriae]MBB5874498.1 hypothetical protein [Allocatelliglobosispora scoriae]